MLLIIIRKQHDVNASPAIRLSGRDVLTDSRPMPSDTDLHRRLANAGIDRLVIAGMQTEMCGDSACRGAVALGYRVVLVADGHTTYDTPIIDAERIIAHHNRLLGHGFADVVTADEVTF
jgi:nicotinamidase-related amidase